MRNPFKAGTPAAFFWEHGGYSYRPDRETQEQGRRRCAAQLAATEARAREAGIVFEWSVSDLTSWEWTDEQPLWAQYDCIAKDAAGAIVGSLCGCDFGKNADGPYGPYRRVVEAEVAAEIGMLDLIGEQSC